MAGAAMRARAKSSLTMASPSPTYMEKTSAPDSGSSVAAAAVAAARARVVLQQPGGPWSNTPRGGRTPSRAKAAACCRGHSTACAHVLLWGQDVGVYAELCRAV